MFVSSFIMQTSGLKERGEGRQGGGWSGVWFSVSELPAKSLGSNKNAGNKPPPPPGRPSQLGSLVQSQGVSGGLSGDLREGPTPGASGPGGSFRGRVSWAPRATSHPGGLPASPEDAGAWVSSAPRGRGGLLEAGRGQSGGGLMMAPSTWAQSA